jgi:ArsR family transcriptional regulator
MSSHLTILSHAGLVKSTREGRNIVYEAVIEPLSALVAELGRLMPR